MLDKMNISDEEQERMAEEHDRRHGADEARCEAAAEMSAEILWIHAILSDNIACFSDKEEDTLPYVTLGEWDKQGGKEWFVPVHVWSKKRGRREVKSLMVEIYDLLHGSPTLRLRYDSQITFLDPDGLTHHGVITFGRV